MPTHHEKLRRPVASSLVPKTPLPSHAPPAVKAGTQGGGTALDRRTSAEMSAKFGHDFSSIRIHTDHHAEDAADAMGANAYALGGDIVFGAGKYNPGSRETDRILAHELTHVVQQAQSGPGDWGRTSGKGDASEREADSLASQVMMGRSVQVQAAPGAAVARDDDDLDGGLPPGGLPPAVTSTPDAPSTPDIPSPPAPSTPFYQTPTAQTVGEVAGNTGDIAGLGSSVTQGALEGGLPGQIAKNFSAAGQVEGVTGGLGAVAGGLSIATGLQTMADPNASGFDKVVGGANVASGGIGILGSILPEFAAGGTAGLAAPVTGAAAGVEGIGAFAGTAAAAGSAGAVLGAGAAGVGIGNLLANHTEVGPDAQNTVGVIDHMLGDAPGSTPGSGTANQSTLVGMDDFRQEAWKKGGLSNDAAAVGVGIAEGAVGLAGAVGGLAEGAWHGLQALGKNMPDSTQEGGY